MHKKYEKVLRWLCQNPLIQAIFSKPPFPLFTNFQHKISKIKLKDWQGLLTTLI